MVEILDDTEHGITTVALNGRLDTDSAPLVQETLIDLLASGASRLVLDFSRLDFTNSLGLRVLLKVAKQLASTGGRLALCGVQPQIMEALEAVGFDRLVTIRRSRAEAAEAVGGASA